MFSHSGAILLTWFVIELQAFGVAVFNDLLAVEAQRAIERGEFQVAREMLYGLLSIIDRVDDRARYDVEARAAFLIGDAFRFEADALALAAVGADDEGGRL